MRPIRDKNDPNWSGEVSIDSVMCGKTEEKCLGKRCLKVCVEITLKPQICQIAFSALPKRKISSLYITSGKIRNQGVKRKICLSSLLSSLDEKLKQHPCIVQSAATIMRSTHFIKLR